MKRIKELTDKYGILQVLGSEGYCPCGQAEIFGIKIETHCWISGCEDNHPHSCVHIETYRDTMVEKSELNQIARLFAKYIQKNYKTKVDIKTRII